MEETLCRHAMLREHDSVLVGVSGGADSVALLYGLASLAPIFGWRIGIAHLNHGLRKKSSDSDAMFVETLARRMNLSYYSRKINLYERGGNLEEEGRKERYNFFAETADLEGFDKIAVGHQAEDCAEQVLLNLLRGSGPSGLGGISPVRGRIIRPLIETSRIEIERFLQAQQLSYCIDQSNRDNRFTRNRIRNSLIPELVHYNPSIIDNLNRLAEVMRDESEWIEDLLAPVLEEATIKNNSQAGEMILSVQPLMSLHTAARRRLIRKALLKVKGDLGRIGYHHIKNILNLASDQDAAGHLHLPGRVRVLRKGDTLRFAKETKPLRSLGDKGSKLQAVPFEYRLKQVGEVAESVRIEEIDSQMLFQQLKFYANINIFEQENMVAVAFIDMDRVELPLVIRNPRPGDRFTPLGMDGTVKLKDFFINKKVPADQRGAVPVVQSGEEIIWVAGMRINERVKITKTTKNVLKISFFRNHTDK
ncbi:MAG: tRNA lysidine(34) synthetase TilS [Desulfobacterales bacterium]|nr:tRNA lysidine(34) synthetase TilS [Desulfobacterales bacterium]